jgi:hypothetical protein
MPSRRPELKSKKYCKYATANGNKPADAAELAERGTLRAGAKERILYEHARTNQSVYCHST